MTNHPITAHREALGMSQSELARRAGVDRVNLNRIERGYHVPHAATLEAIAAALGTTPERLREGDDLAHVLDAIQGFRKLPRDSERLEALVDAVNDLARARGIRTAPRAR
jgi:transcriptional regulator with XRE-family HTH domain